MGWFGGWKSRGGMHEYERKACVGSDLKKNERMRILLLKATNGLGWLRGERHKM